MLFWVYKFLPLDQPGWLGPKERIIIMAEEYKIFNFYDIDFICEQYRTVFIVGVQGMRLWCSG